MQLLVELPAECGAVLLAGCSQLSMENKAEVKEERTTEESLGNPVALPMFRTA